MSQKLVSFALTCTLQIYLANQTRSDCDMLLSVIPFHFFTQKVVSHEMGTWRSKSPYRQDFGETKQDTASSQIFPASCRCGRVRYNVRGEPESAKLCHCRDCQQLHGAPFEWVGDLEINFYLSNVDASSLMFQYCLATLFQVSIFHKHNVRFHPESLDYLYFYSIETDKGWESAKGDERCLPVKVSCSHCRTPVADEGRSMWLAFATLFGFTVERGIPKGFEHSCHLFYRQRCMDIDDDMMKWEGHKNKSKEWKRKDKK
jgi:hypothetical protein